MALCGVICSGPSFLYRRAEIYYKTVKEQKGEVIPFLFHYFPVMMGIQILLFVHYDQEVKVMKTEITLK